MIDGLYAVHFKSSNDEGTGVVAIANGSINGGDSGYYYQGTLDQNDQGLSTRLTVTKFNPLAESVFGPLDSFTLELSGPSSERGFELSGHLVEHSGHKLSVEGHYLKPLV